MIPKKIHYFWFGKGEKSKLEKECISRFSGYVPGAEIIEWNEENFDINSHPYTKDAYINKKWAFVSDYARLKVLYEEGGIYLDTDMFLLKDLSELFNQGAFIGKEDDIHISAGIIGAEPKHPFIRDVLCAYDNLTERKPIPKVLTEVYNQNNNSYNIKVYTQEIFYPFNQYTIKNFNKNNPPKESIAVHMWNYSWGSPAAKLLKKVGLHQCITKALDKLGIKKIVKKVLKME